MADHQASSSRVICLDELFVTDVADAMILARLFARLFDRGVTLVATSNRAPEKLYENGLQRPTFVPFIHRLQQECVVHNLDSPVDYRTLAHRTIGLYFVRFKGGHTNDERPVVRARRGARCCWFHSIAESMHSCCAPLPRNWTKCAVCARWSCEHTNQIAYSAT